MSLFDFVDGKKPPGDGKKPAPPKPPAKKTPVKKAKVSPKLDTQEGDDTSWDAEQAPDDNPSQRGSALKSAGLVKFSLACEKCKHKKDVMLAGEPKPQHLICKKCGSTMKLLRKR